MTQISNQILFKYTKSQVLLLIPLVFIFTVLAFLSREIFMNESFRIDTIISQNIYSLRNPNLTALMIGISYWGERLAIVLTIIFSIWFIITKEFKLAYIFFGTIILANGIALFLKNLLARSRPDTAYRLVAENGYSFPSGHSTIAFSVYPILAVLVMRSNLKKTYKKVVSGLLILWAIAIGFSRIYLGVHYFTDVVGGLLLGTLFTMLFWLWSQKYPVKRI